MQPIDRLPRNVLYCFTYTNIHSCICQYIKAQNVKLFRWSPAKMDVSFQLKVVYNMASEKMNENIRVLT